MARRYNKNVPAVSLNHTDTFNIIIAPKNDEQQVMLDTISSNIITFVKGSPGTGKSYIAVTYALQQYLKHKFERIVFSRPVVEAAGEHLGYLPGSMQEKINPYMAPIFEIMSEVLPVETIKKLTNKNGVEPAVRVLPMAYMRGVTLKRSIIVVDECQNMSVEQLRMLLTRLGEDSKMILCGDIRQSDIPRANGLEEAFTLLEDIEQIGFVTLSQNAVVRHPLIKKIEERFEERLKKRKK